jgi:hypothetical protein
VVRDVGEEEGVDGAGLPGWVHRLKHVFGVWVGVIVGHAPVDFDELFDDLVLGPKNEAKSASRRLFLHLKAVKMVR